MNYRTLASFLSIAVLIDLVHSTEYVVPVGNVSEFFAKLPKDATAVVFSAAAEYRCNVDIVLPDAQLLVIDGRGAKLVLGPNSNGFTRRVADQKEAMRMTASRYTIRDFASIEGGRKAIDLQATLGSIIENCRLVDQTETAIDLRFCLMTTVRNVLVTKPAGRGIVLRTGDWPGATWANSQSNSSVLEQCRVYCSSTTTQAFAVLNSGGVRMSDCISEGGPSDHDLYLSAVIDGDENKPAKNSVVKSFTLSNFHVEHAVRQASIHVNMPPQSSIDLSNIYWNGKQTAPVIRYLGGQLNISNIGWFTSDYRIVTRVSAPRINADRCHSALDTGGKVLGGGTRAGVLALENPLPGNEVLKLNYVRVTRTVR